MIYNCEITSSDPKNEEKIHKKWHINIIYVYNLNLLNPQLNMFLRRFDSVWFPHLLLLLWLSRAFLGLHIRTSTFFFQVVCAHVSDATFPFRRRGKRPKRSDLGGKEEGNDPAG